LYVLEAGFILQIENNYWNGSKTQNDPKERSLTVMSKLNRVLLCSLLSAILLFTELLYLPEDTNHQASASSIDLSQSTVLQLPNTDLSAWTLDESSGYIFALAYNSNQMLFINYHDMTVAKTIDIGSRPMDLIVEDGKIYIGLDGAYQIKVVDILTGEITQTLLTTGNVNRLAKDANYIYYASTSPSRSVYKYEIATGQESVVSMPQGTSSSIKDLEVNQEQNLLYVANSYLFALELEDLTQFKSRIELGGYNFAPPIVTQGNDLFFAARRFNATDLTEVRGLYSSFAEYHPDRVLQVRDQLVITDRHIYDKDTYRIMASLPEQTLWAAMDSEQYIYTVSSTRRLIKTKVELPPLAYDGHHAMPDRLQLRVPITDWVSDNERIFAISTDNTLLQINKASMMVEKETDIGSKPLNIAISDQKLYVANSGSSTIDVINAIGQMSPASVQLSAKFPYAVAPGQDQIFFAASDISRGGKSLYAYSSVSQAVYEIKNGIMSIDADYIQVSPEHGKLYASDNNRLYGIGLQYPYTVQIMVSNFEYSTRSLIVDGSSIYAGTKKFSMNQPAALQATFPEQVLFAKGDYVFTKDAIYNSNTAVKLFDLPFTVGLVEMDESGAIYLCKGDKDPSFNEKSGLTTIYKFDSITKLQSFMDNFIPGKAMFLDFNNEERLVEGLIVFEPAVNDDDVAFYEIEYMDEELQQSSSMGRVYKDDLYNGLYIYETGGFYPQTHQTHIAIYGYIAVDNGNRYRRSSGYSLARIWDMPTFLAGNVMFTDTDPHADKIGGTLAWTPGSRKKNDEVYEIYFAGENGLMGNRLAAVNTMQGISQFNIPVGTVIPEGALALAVIYTDARGETAPFYTMAPILDRMTRTPNEDDISVNNQVGNANDSITVSNLRSGETVRIYDYNDELLHTIVPAAGQTTLTIKVTHLDPSGGEIFLSLQAEGKAESLTATKAYGKEQPGSPSGGGSGGVGGGGGIGGGGVMPTVPLPPANTQEIAIDIKPVTDNDGRTRIVAAVGNLQGYLEENKNQKVIPIVVKSDDTHSIVEVQFVGKELLALASNLNGKTLEIISKFGTLRMEAKELLSTLTDQSVLKVQIAQVSEKRRADIEKSAVDLGMTTLGVPVEFEVTAVTGKKVVELQPKDAYWAHIIELEQLPENIDSGKLAGVMFDPVSGTLIPVPSTFKLNNGRLTGTMWRKGNSSYVIVQKALSFSDLPGNPEAKMSIESLAARLIVNGYVDGTFRPNQDVTRSEFAALLIRALGIVTQSGSENVFSDVKPEHWFYDIASAASKMNLIRGYKDGTFRPQQTITHSEMITMLGNALQYIQGEYTASEGQQRKTIDALQLGKAVPAWAQKSLAAIAELGVVQAGDQTVGTWNDNTTRQESAIYLYRMLKAISFIN